jgi:tetratricopeptide (TPR) repeat protein
MCGKSRWLVSLIATFLVASQAAGQDESRRVPKAEYFLGLQMMAAGELKDAEQQLQNAVRGSIKTAQSRWIDSICAYTAQGELFRQQGRYTEALESYETAVRLAIQFPTWVLDLTEPPVLRQAVAGQVRVPPWGRSQRGAAQATWPDTYLIKQGALADNELLAEGGVYKPPMLFPVLAGEILSSTTLALKRRRELLGPACAYDPLSAELAATWSQAHPGPNHWTASWFDVLIGVAFASHGRDDLAAPFLVRGTVAQGKFDHPLTGAALTELARIAYDSGNYPKAIDLALEASYVAYATVDVQRIEDALRMAHSAHVLDNRPGMLPALPEVLTWAHRKDFRKLEVSVLIAMAESSPTPEAAAKHLQQASTYLKRTDLDQSFLAPRWCFQSGRLAYVRGEVAAGDALVAESLSTASRYSLRLFQAQIVDALARIKWFTTRDATDLYGLVLREPTAQDWRIDPLESLWIESSSLSAPMERWFLLAASRDQADQAVEIADLARRRRFYATQPLGGRLLGLRWLLDGPDGRLDQQARLERQDILNAVPEYAAVSRQAAQLTTELSRLPLAPGDGPDKQRRLEVTAALASASTTQEAMLRNVAVARQGARRSVPPQRPTAELRAALQPRQAVLAYFVTAPQVYGFLITAEKTHMWEAGRPDQVAERARALLAALGQTGDGHRLRLAQYNNTAWRQAARELFAGLTSGINETDWYTRYDELIVVPDWVLWYTPFELIGSWTSSDVQYHRVGNEINGLPDLICRTRVRYVPTVGLAITNLPRPRSLGPSVVALGRVAERDDPALAERTFEDLEKRVKGTIALPPHDDAVTPLAVAGWDRLTIFHGLDPTPGFPHGWPLLALDRKRLSVTPADLLNLPMGGPSEYVLPGFRTAAEHNLQGIPVEAAGSEIFLNSCALIASGARTVLLSRWRNGGQSTHDLMTEFLQELPHTTASDAWQRSVLLCAENPIRVDCEPRLDFPIDIAAPKANHPFLWAGYLLIDTGSQPPGDLPPGGPGL